MHPKLTVVFDTQIFLRATVNAKSLVRKIVFEKTHLYELIYSVETRLEIEEVLSRSKIQKKFPELTEYAKKETLSRITNGVLVTLPNPIPSISRDPKDDIFLACAIAGKAQYLVTQDNDLLVLNPYETLQIVDIPTFWQILQNQDS